MPPAALGEGVSGAGADKSAKSQAPIINLFSIGPTLSYAVDPFGGNRRRVEQQEATTQFQEYQLDAAYLTLTGGAATQAGQIPSARRQNQGGGASHAADEGNPALGGSPPQV